MTAQVFFSNLRTRPGITLLDKLKKLVRRACIDSIVFEKKLVAIKLHFGEVSNLAYIRPNYAARLVDIDACVGCRLCERNCAQHAITMSVANAARANWNESSEICTEKIAEYAYAVVKDKPAFHINFVMDISPDCDSWPNNDLPIAADVGILASFDPVALDRASVDLVNSAALIPGSKLDEVGNHPGDDKFITIHPDTDWKPGLLHAESIGLCTQSYELITVK